MWFRPLSAIVLASLFLLASICTASRVAVAFVDVKFDDKAAIWSLMLDPTYDKVVAITEGIHAHGQAARELQEYLDRQNAMGYRIVDTRRLKIFSGSTVFQGPVKHENWWSQNSLLNVDVAEKAALRRELHGNQVRVFQLAPTAMDDVKMVIKAADPNSIETYMLLHGYNSKQENMARQTYFLQNLRSWVARKNPQAHVIFTSSMDSYAARDGGKQPLAAIQHLFPQYDLHQAANDNFWARQLIRAESMSRIPLARHLGSNPGRLEEIILDARIRPEENESWRTYFRSYIQAVLAKYPPEDHENNQTLKRLRYTLLPEFSNPTTLELADAAHVAAFHRYFNGQSLGHNTGMHVEPVRFPDGPHAENAAVGFEPAHPDYAHGWLLRGANRDIDLQHIKQLAGVWH